jgi:hypothetical protein
MRALVQGLFPAAFLLAMSLQRAAQHTGDTPQLVTDQGLPTLRFTGYPGSYDVAYQEHLGGLAFRFFGCPKPGYAGCDKEHGFLYVTRNRVVYESESSGSGFDIPRAELVEARTDRATIRFFLLHGQQPFMLVGQGRRNEDISGSAEAQARRWLALAVSNFSAAEQEFKRLTASLQPNLPPQASPAPAQTEPAKPPPPPLPKLVLSTEPGNVGVYVDDEFKGISSGEGRLVISNLPPGSHHLRSTVIGYKELAQSLDLAAGETKTVEAKLDPAGPKPVALAEIEEALSNGVPKKRVMALVGQFGVDFSLSEEAEQRLRKSGADSDLLLLITKSKK